MSWSAAAKGYAFAVELVLHAGVYKGKRLDKRDMRGRLRLTQSGLHGFPLRAQATAEKPLVIKAAGDGVQNRPPRSGDVSGCEYA